MKSSGSKNLLKFLAISLAVGIAHIGCTEVDTYNAVRGISAATTPAADKCPTCKGLGHYLLSDGQTTINCPTCDGTGLKKK
jgi:DnaJ-class molecular chaperone